jgi:hypothetical protein
MVEVVKMSATDAEDPNREYTTLSSRVEQGRAGNKLESLAGWTDGAFFWSLKLINLLSF